MLLQLTISFFLLYLLIPCTYAYTLIQYFLQNLMTDNTWRTIRYGWLNKRHKCKFSFVEIVTTTTAILSYFSSFALFCAFMYLFCKTKLIHKKNVSMHLSKSRTMVRWCFCTVLLLNTREKKNITTTKNTMNHR